MADTYTVETKRKNVLIVEKFMKGKKKNAQRLEKRVQSVLKKVCKTKNVERIEDENRQIFNIKKDNIQNTGSRNGDTKIKMKINNCVAEMQIDTGSEITIIPRNLWGKNGKTTFKKKQRTITSV